MPLQINDEFDPMIDAAGQYYNVDPALIKTVFHVESGGNPNVGRGTSGEIGGMQIMPVTAARLGVPDPTDMTQAIPAAARLLREGLDATGTPGGALRYYNGGGGGPNNPATIPYVLKAQALYGQMQLKKAGALKGQPNTSPTTPAAPDDVDLGSQIIKGKSGTTPSPSAPTSTAPTAQGADPDVTAGHNLITQTTTPTQTPQTAQTEQEQPQHGMLARLGIGLAEGAKEAIDVPAEFLARHFGGNAVTSALGMPTAEQTAAADAANRAAYHQGYGSDTAAEIGRDVGGLATNALIGYAAGAPIRAGAAALGSRVLAPQIIETGTFPPYRVGLTGAQQAARYGLNLLSGAGQGAVGAEVVGGNPLYGAVGGGVVGGLGAGAESLAESGVINRLMQNEIARRLAASGGLALGASMGGGVGALAGREAARAAPSIVPPIVNMLLRGASKLSPALAGEAAGEIPSYVPVP